MAQLEGAVFVALLAKRFKVSIPEGHKTKLWMAVTTVSETGTPVFLKPWTKDDGVAEWEGKEKEKESGTQAANSNAGTPVDVQANS